MPQNRTDAETEGGARVALRYLCAGEQGLVVEFGNNIDAAVNARVHRLAQALRPMLQREVLELVPTYRSLMVYFDPLRISRTDLIRRITDLAEQEVATAENVSAAKVVYIPVCYGGEYGPDLEFVARHTGLSETEVVAIHTSTPYQVYMLGFTPGFPYLGGMSERIAAPRLAQPRTKIPAGSVGIAGSQTGLYPIESPGGWQIIGQTPVKAFDPDASAPFLFAAGEYLQFVSITPEEYQRIRQEVTAGVYEPRCSWLMGGVAG